jgi:DNA-binding transcriptional LysR family regulator
MRSTPAGRNYALEEEVRVGRLDLALAFCRPGPDKYGVRLASLPMLWFGARPSAKPPADDRIPLVLFDHPCLFRQTAFQALEAHNQRWRLSLTTPSLPGVWAALRFGHGVTVRTTHLVPVGIHDVGAEFGLPNLPPIELRKFTGSEPSPAVAQLQEVLEQVVCERVIASVCSK